MRHDQGYKFLFSRPEMVKDLLRGFVPSSWGRRLDLDTIERVSGSYVSKKLSERHSDMVWRVRFTDTSWLYVYLLLEFQSEPDPYMALRIMVYQGLLYQDLIAREHIEPGRTLPPVVPLVLYNGSGPWTAAVDVARLVAPVSGFEPFVPRCRYLLIDEARYEVDELLERRNLVAALFRLEQSRDSEAMLAVLLRLVEWLQTPGQEPLREAFEAWVNQVLVPGRFATVAPPGALRLSEGRDMLAERAEQWRRELREQGKAEGMARMLVRQLCRRFGDLPPATLARIQQEKDTDRLELWADRVITANSLDEVFR